MIEETRSQETYEILREAKRALDSGEATELKAAEAKGRAGDPKGMANKPK